MTIVTRLQDLPLETIPRHFSGFGLSVTWVDANSNIPGSHWGDEEAGLIGNTLYVRRDTPVHSALHEGGHWLLMPAERRLHLHTDAGGTLAEENAVCYLQVLMADFIAHYSRQQLFADMDAWGYSFRLGSSELWFCDDADDALAWLRARRPDLLKRFSAVVSQASLGS